MLLFLTLGTAFSEGLGCPGPHAGWLSSAPSRHGDVVSLPGMSGHVLCCHGILGAVPSVENVDFVRNVRPHPNGSRYVVGVGV